MDRFFKSLIYVSIASFIFIILRLLLLIVYKKYFFDLNLFQISLAFIEGLRFDFSIIFIFFALPLLFYNLPFKRLSFVSLFVQYILYAICIIMFLFMLCDIIYFQYVFRHIGSELVVIGNDCDFIWGLALKSYLKTIIAFVLASFLILRIWKKIIEIDEKNFFNPFIRFFLIMLIIFLGIRGTFTRKPISVIDAFKSGNTKISNLILNGVFSAYHSSTNSKKINHNHYDNIKALKILGLTDSEYPLLKNVKPLFNSKPNIIFILMESWDYDYIDSFGNNNFKVTSNFDKLAKNGIKFTNFFASGQRSIDGIQSSLIGIPPISGLPYLGTGLEVSNFSKVGNIAHNEGYYSIFIQGFKRRSFRMDSVSKNCGFDEYYGMEDIPIIYPYPNPKESQYGWDYDMLMFLKNKIDKIKEPFLAWTLTSTTHGPFAKIDKQFLKYPHDINGEGGFLNTLYYSDWSIGQFIKKASKTKWFDNTIFIFCSDHTLKNFRTSDFNKNYKIPFLIYSPKYFKAETKETICSQLDILSTIASLFNSKEKIGSFGENVFYKKTPYVFVAEGNNLGIITKDGFLKHSRQNRLDRMCLLKESNDSYFNNLEEKILSFDQIHFKLWKENKFVK